MIMVYPIYMDTLSSLKFLDAELASLGIERTLYICGGAALILLKVTTRTTMDIDVLRPDIDPTLDLAARKVATNMGLSESWLNNGPKDLLAYLGKRWEEDCTKVYEGPALQVFALGRMDLIKSKLWSACDRMDDIPDLIALNPTPPELQEAHSWVLLVDASEIWPHLVEGCLKELERRRRHG